MTKTAIVSDTRSPDTQVQAEPVGISESRIPSARFRDSIAIGFDEVASLRIEHATALSKAKDVPAAGRKAAREIVKHGTGGGTEVV